MRPKNRPGGNTELASLQPPVCDVWTLQAVSPRPVCILILLPADAYLMRFSYSSSVRLTKKINSSLRGMTAMSLYCKTLLLLAVMASMVPVLDGAASFLIVEIEDTTHATHTTHARKDTTHARKDTTLARKDTTHSRKDTTHPRKETTPTRRSTKKGKYFKPTVASFLPNTLCFCRINVEHYKDVSTRGSLRLYTL